MKKIIASILVLTASLLGIAQNGITPQQLLELNRVSAKGISEDGKNIVFSVAKVDVKANKRNTKHYIMPITGGNKSEISDVSEYIKDKNVSPTGNQKIVVEDVKLEKVDGKDFYPDMNQSNMQIYESLNYRHWDHWEDGAFSHLFLSSIKNPERKRDIMSNEPYDCPTQPFGGSEDYTWCPKGEKILYVCKKKSGTEYATSTNTDIYEYTLKTGSTKNLTAHNLGYDLNPTFSVSGKLAYTQMKRDGFESDKNDLIIFLDDEQVNITENWDGTVGSFTWSNDEKSIFFLAATGGEKHLFKIEIPKSKNKITAPKQITSGVFDVRGIVGEVGNQLIVTRGDMNHASEIYSVDLKTGKMMQLSHENDAFYNSISLSKIDKRITKTTDGKDMVSWVIYPPNFDANKKYPTLLYCQGGPQGALSQFYSYRWNFQLMAANGYIVIAPNRRGMPGYGVKWNEDISKDYGGQCMDDYLSAIDDIAKETYVDKDALGCVGASFGGYSAFYLAGNHNGRFKTFISHDGIFNWTSMYGTTEEIFFANFDLGGPYWSKDALAQKAYNEFNPINYVQNWDTPILIIQGGIDYRVPIGQGLEAFNAAQLRGIKSKLLYFPEENHWVLDYQNSLIWHKEFAKWLDETLR